MKITRTTAERAGLHDERPDALIVEKESKVGPDGQTTSKVRVQPVTPKRQTR